MLIIKIPSQAVKVKHDWRQKAKTLVATLPRRFLLFRRHAQPQSG